MRNGRSAFVLDKLFSTIDGKKGLASLKTNYEVARLVSHLRKPITRLQDWSCTFENQLQGCKIGLASSKTNYKVARTNLLLKTRSTRD